MPGPIHSSKETSARPRTARTVNRARPARSPRASAAHRVSRGVVSNITGHRGCRVQTFRIVAPVVKPQISGPLPLSSCRRESRDARICSRRRRCPSRNADDDASPAERGAEPSFGWATCHSKPRKVQQRPSASCSAMNASGESARPCRLRRPVGHERSCRIVCSAKGGGNALFGSPTPRIRHARPGSATGRLSPFCRSSMEMPSGLFTKAMRPSRGAAQDGDALLLQMRAGLVDVVHAR